MYDTRNPGHDFDYELALSFADGKPMFRIIELGLAASGSDLESAFREILRLKQDYLEKARETDRLDTLPLPIRRSAGIRQDGPSPGNVSMKTNLISFLIKVGIVYASIMLVIGIAILAIRPAIRSSVGKNFWTKAEDNLHRSATSNGMPPDVQARVLADVRTLVARYKPFADELRPLFSDEPPKSNPAAK